VFNVLRLSGVVSDARGRHRELTAPAADVDGADERHPAGVPGRRRSVSREPGPRASVARPRAHVRFAHESEQRFARILDFYGVEWEYEPVEFVLDWVSRPAPHLGLPPRLLAPATGPVVEVTTLNQRLVTKKNGKVRRMSQLYPEVRVTLLYQRDTLALLAKYDWPAPVPDRARWPFGLSTAGLGLHG